MSFISTLILALSPVAVTLLTQFTKNLPVVDSLPQGFRKSAIRLIAAGFSVLGAFGAYMSGGDLDHAVIEQFVAAAGVFASTQVPYLIGKLKKNK